MENVRDSGKHAVIDALHIHLKNPIEVAFRGCFEFADVRDTSVVHQGVDAAALRELLKYGAHFLLVGYIAFMG